MAQYRMLLRQFLADSDVLIPTISISPNNLGVSAMQDIIHDLGDRTERLALNLTFALPMTICWFWPATMVAGTSLVYVVVSSD